MDFHALQQKLYNLDPTDPREDLEKLKAAAQGPMHDHAIPPTKDYVNESAKVPEGSLQLDKDYSVYDFAALAGVIGESKQKPADKVRAQEPMPTARAGRTEHPFKNRLVGEEEDSKDKRIAKLEKRVAKLEALIEGEYSSDAQRKAVHANKSNKKNNKVYDDIKTKLYDKLAEMENKRK